MSTPAEELLASLAAGWPAQLQIGGEPVAEGHPLALEIEAIRGGAAASLPHFGEERVAWLTVAPDAERLREAIDDLRAWVIPSLGWEDHVHPLVIPSERRGGKMDVLAVLSPSGYFRWWSRRGDFAAVADRLRSCRELARARPIHVVAELPSLFELRQRFHVALALGDRGAAETALTTIDSHDLDRAVNLHLMRVRLWERFGETHRIAQDPALDRLAPAEVPTASRLAILETFHTAYLVGPEAEGSFERALEAFRGAATGRIEALLDASQGADGFAARRCLAYRAVRDRDALAAAALSRWREGDEVVRWALASLGEPAPALGIGGEALPAAWREGDWARVQELGTTALQEGAGRFDLEFLLRQSLQWHPDQTLAARLGVREAEAGRAGVRDWAGLGEALRRGDWSAAQEFLDQAERQRPAAMEREHVGRLIADVEDLFTDPGLHADATAASFLQGGLAALIEDFVSEPGFPRQRFLPLYRTLLRIWATEQQGSASPPDGQLLLVLAAEVLRGTADAQSEVMALVRQWWKARKIRARLPFLIEALDLLTEYTEAGSDCESLWLEGAALVQRDPSALPRTERLMWRSVGLRLGLDADTADAFLGLADAELEEAADPLWEAALERIAIVSLHERAASQAAALLRERTGAQVSVVVTEAAGPATDQARTCDVILFVWSANKHAVYRAFDDVRDRLAYVQGTGPASIVLALERWVAANVMDSPVAQ